MNEALMQMVIESGLEAVAEKLMWFCKTRLIDISSLTADDAAAYLDEIQFNKEATLNYSLFASGLMN